MDTLFLVKAEKQLLTGQLWARSKIQLYLRYRDDIYIQTTAEGKESTYAWVKALRIKAGYFKVTCEQVAYNLPGKLDLVKFLNFNVRLDGKSGRPTIAPYIKTTGCPLTSESSHHRSQSGGWQAMMFSNTARISSNTRLLTQAWRTLSAWFRTALVDESQIEAWKLEAHRKYRGAKRNQDPPESRFWLVFPWHPSYALKNVLAAAVAEANSRACLLEQAFGRRISLGLAWKKPGVSVFSIFETQDNDIYGADGWE